MMKNFNICLTISKYTVKEILQSKILLNVLLLGIGILVISYVAFSLTYGDTSRVALNFGLGALSISSVGIGIFFGVNLLANEMDNRTVYMIISRPVSRTLFLCGKMIGLSLVLLLNILILSILTIFVFLLAKGAWNDLILWALLFIALESILIMVISSFFSLITNRIPAVLYSIIIYITGNVINDTMLISFVKDSLFIKYILSFYQYVLPAFYKFNIRDFVIYGEDLSFSFLGMSLLYGFFYTGAIVMLSIIIFNRKDLN